MSTKSFPMRIVVFLGLAAGLASVGAFAGSEIIGSVVGSSKVTLSGQPLLPNTALFSGDRLNVKDGTAWVTMEKGSRMILDREAIASFERAPEGVNVFLEQGSVSIYQPERGTPMRIREGDLAILPVKGLKTLGEVAMLKDEVTVTASKGRLRVEGPERAVEVAEGETIKIIRTDAHTVGNAAAAGHAAAHSSLGHGLVVAAVGAGGAAAAVGAAGHGGKSSSTLVLLANHVSNTQTTGAGSGKGVAFGQNGKNPTAVAQVAAHAPPEACEHAASPSVPAVACGDQ